MFKTRTQLKEFLDRQVERFNHPDFIGPDPISIPHRFSSKEDIEIAGFIAAVFSWGQRKTILNKCLEFLALMDNQPHQFLLHHSDLDLKPFTEFRHRTFNGTDALFFIHFLQGLYKSGSSLEKAFFPKTDSSSSAVEKGLLNFRQIVSENEFFPKRTGKHISSPASGSACKRLCMYLRWMVRSDQKGVDFGIWNSVSPSQLICPCDVHVERNARLLGLVKRPKPDWTMALELTENLKELDPLDPVKYDFALFGMGISGEFF